MKKKMHDMVLICLYFSPAELGENVLTVKWELFPVPKSLSEIVMEQGQHIYFGYPDA